MSKLKLLKDTMPHIDYYIDMQNKVMEVLDYCVKDGLVYEPLNFNIEDFDFDDLCDLISNILHDISTHLVYLRDASDYTVENIGRLIEDNLKYIHVDINQQEMTYEDIYSLAWNVAHDVLQEDSRWINDRLIDEVLFGDLF